MAVLTGVTGILSCAHQPINADIFGGELHGHSYEVTAWFTNDHGADVRIFEAALRTLLDQWDHRLLPVEISTAEAIAAAVGTLAKCIEVEVRRPLERFHARWRAE